MSYPVPYRRLEYTHFLIYNSYIKTKHPRSDDHRVTFQLLDVFRNSDSNYQILGQKIFNFHFRFNLGFIMKTIFFY